MKGFEEFKEALKKRESGNNYRIINKYGFLGAYQFGKPRLYDLGYSVNGWKPKNKPEKQFISTEEFLNNEELQDKLFFTHIERLKNYFNRRYSDYFDTVIMGIKITLSGLVAGAHLKGAGGVARFLQGKDNADALGTKVSEYIELFSGYDLDEVKEITIKNDRNVTVKEVKAKGMDLIK